MANVKMTKTPITPHQKSSQKRVLLLNSGEGWSTGENKCTRFENPIFSLRVQNGNIVLETRGDRFKKEGNPLDILETFLNKGYYAVGYFGYEFFKFIKRDFAPSSHKNGAGLPEVYFLFFDEYEQEKVDEPRRNPNTKIGTDDEINLHPNMTKSKYIDMIDRARSYIAQGDIYQVNLSQRFKFPLKVPAQNFLFRLFNEQPVPFACYLDFGKFQLVSGSMELFLRKNGRKIITRPIKGTRKRGLTRKGDENLRSELFESEKERAENLMIVDLMRNDLGRICEFGSVQVNELFKIEAYATLYQMVSEVAGRLRDETTTADILRATFPPGSVTGAPKRRAMEIIDELEPHLRGPYCGAIGIFEPSGDFELSVAIRVLASVGGKGTYWAGGGIVWDSVPDQEYEEILIKSRATMKTLNRRIT